MQRLLLLLLLKVVVVLQLAEVKLVLVKLLVQLGGLGGVHGMQHLLAAHGIWVLILIYRLVDVIDAFQMPIGRRRCLSRFSQLPAKGVTLLAANSNRA